MDYEAILDEVLASPNWRDMGGLGADDMYGQLAMDVARLAVSRALASVEGAFSSAEAAMRVVRQNIDEAPAQ